jgi:hypothetical protein
VQTIPALLELGSVVLDPAQNGARRDGNPALGHHLGEIPVRELVAQIPTDAQDDDLGIEMTALEKLRRGSAAAHQAAHSRGIVEHLPQRAVCNRTLWQAFPSTADRHAHSIGLEYLAEQNRRSPARQAALGQAMEI